MDVEPEFLIALYLATYLSRAKAGATLSAASGVLQGQMERLASGSRPDGQDTWTWGPNVRQASCPCLQLCVWSPPEAGQGLI